MNDVLNLTWNVNITQYAVGAFFNLAVAVIIVRFIYHPLTPNRGYAFSFIAFNTAIYFLLGLMGSIELTVGLGFGLFAIFSVLRYRTEEMPIREMTYLFILIALPVMNSVIGNGGEFFKVALANASIIVVLFFLEREFGFTFQSSKRITYEKIELIRPANRQRLIDDLRERTGLSVSRVEVGRIDFLRDTAEIVIFYDTPTLSEEERQEGLSNEFQPAGRQLLEPR
jgi:hypothetical protein